MNLKLSGLPCSLITRIAIRALDNRLAQKSLRLGSPKNDAVDKKLPTNTLN